MQSYQINQKKACFKVLRALNISLVSKLSLSVKYFYNLIVLNNTCNVSIQRARAVSFLGKLLRSSTFLWKFGVLSQQVHAPAAGTGSPADLANVFNLSRITKVQRNCPHCPRNCPHFPVIDICPQCPYSPKYLSITS